MTTPARSRIAPHVVLIGCAMFEILQLEITTASWQHFLSNFLLISAYVVAACRISRRRLDGAIVAVFGFGAWVLDLAGSPVLGFEIVLWSAFHASVAWIITVRVARCKSIEAREVVDAVTVFLLAGITFANLYLLARLGDPGALVRGNGNPLEIEFGQFLYFSFMTQLTIGYGDIAPVGKWAQALTVFQGLFGVFYIAILIAYLVSTVRQGRPEEAPAGSEN